jgi:rubrerythrin
MYCLNCHLTMQPDEHHTGTDENLDGMLYAYAYWVCKSCGTQVNDWHDRYEPPTDT